MTGELSKTISTCTIWLAIAIILTFGLYRMNGDMMFFVFTTLIIVGGAVLGTAFIWVTTWGRLENIKKQARGFEVIPPTADANK